jgi:hypothetical protein
MCRRSSGETIVAMSDKLLRFMSKWTTSERHEQGTWYKKTYQLPFLFFKFLNPFLEGADIAITESISIYMVEFFKVTHLRDEAMDPSCSISG